MKIFDKIYNANNLMINAFEAVKAANKVIDEPHKKILNAYLNEAKNLMEFHYYEEAADKFSEVSKIANNMVAATTA